MCGEVKCMNNDNNDKSESRVEKKRGSTKNSGNNSLLKTGIVHLSPYFRWVIALQDSHISAITLRYS